MNNLKIITTFFILLSTISLYAREGMWIPMFLNKNIDEMQEMGFQLNTDDIYNVNHSSLKDAVVLFGRGCTGEIISPDGLLITNHHCGYDQIQAHSSIEHDYLTNGFWAMKREDELPNEGLSVSILVEMRDVTEKILAGTDTCLTDFAVSSKINENSVILTDEAIEGTHYKAKIKSFFNRNQYFLIIYEQFNDIRLVGAPPSAIGKFGGDTDNWMWPRHTGDFSMFRIYADKDNNPADYSPDNVPYHPKKYLPINISGIEEGDFAMVFGYPANTQQNLYSKAVEQIIEQRNPDRIAIRDIKLDILSNYMNKNPETRIQYAAKYAHTSNAWKKWQGEIKGLKKLDAVDVKKEREEKFAKWVAQTNENQYKYGNILSEFDRLYTAIAPFQKAKDYYDEIIKRGTDSYKMYSHIRNITADDFNSEEEIKYIKKHFKDYKKKVDQDVFIALINKYKTDISDSLFPTEIETINDKKLEKIYSKSLLTNEEELTKILFEGKPQTLICKIKRDKLFNLFKEFEKAYNNKIAANYNSLTKIINQNQKDYVAALLEMNSDILIFPDANQTLRVSYGKIEGFSPADGIQYNHYTTLKGIIEKDNPGIYDYDVPNHLKALYANHDYGRYANNNGELPVCFTASTHTTGGNSGSPVLDANGYLIGINFDRCWEGTMSDIMFDPEKCRNISLDMRYMLFLIDKLAGAGYLLNEMEIIE